MQIYRCVCINWILEMQESALEVPEEFAAINCYLCALSSVVTE